MTSSAMVTIIAIGLACITLMVVTATLMGHDTGLVTGAVGVITSAISAMIGIVGGGKAKEKKVKKYLEEVAKKRCDDSYEEV